MDNCAIGRFTVTTPLSEEQNKKLSNYIYAVSKDDVAASMIVADFNNGLVEQFVRNHKTLKDKYTKPLHELLHQEFKAVIKEYKKYTYPSINDFTKASSSEARGLFVDVAARNFALRETSRLLADEYYNLAFKTNTTSLRGKANATKIINAAKLKAANTFLDRFKVFLSLNEEEKGFEEYINKFKELNKITKEATRALEVLREYKTKKALTADENKKALELNKLYKDDVVKINSLKEELLFAGFPIVNSHPNATNEDKNYAAMISNMFMKETSNNWFYEVYNLPRTFAIRSAFNSIFEDRISEAEKTSDAFGEIDENFEFIDEDELSVDQNTGNWSDALYNNYLKHFDGKLTVYLGNLYKTKPVDIASGDGKYSYDTNNPLGVPETMGIGYTISQIINFGDFSSIENFIDSIENVAKNIPTLYGLMKLVNDMRNDNSFANEVFSNFYKYPVRKSMISYVNGDASIYHSNPKAFSGQYLFQKAFSAAKITSQTEVTPKDLNKINEFINVLGQISENRSARTKSDIATFIKDLFNQYFPGVNDDALLTWYWKDGGSIDKANQILNAFKEFVNASRKLNKEILDKKLEVNTYNRWLRKKIKETKENSDGSPTIYDDLKPAKVPYDKFDYSELQKTTKKIIKIFEEFLPAYNEYNSANAENNNSSDLIKNSYITQFFKQIKDTEVNPDGSVTPRGLELIKDFYTRKGERKETLQHQYSTILFGIPGVRDGLFIERNGSYFVNPNAVDMLNISLFNGIRNRDSASGEMYQKMTSLDYFNTLVNYYFNPVDYDNNLSNKDDYCGILFRIPSDASNQYVFQMKKYKYNGLYTYNKEDINKFANERLYSPYTSSQGVKYDFSKLTDRYSKNLNPSIVKGELGGKDKNIKSAADIIEILRNGNLQLDNTFGYKIEYVNNKMFIPLIYLEKGNSFVVYCETDSKNYKEVRNLKPVSIQSLERIKIDADDSFSIGSFFGDETVVYNTINNVFKKFVENHQSEIAKSGFQAGAVKREYNYNNELYQAFVQNVKGEINNFFNAITDLIEVEDKNGTVRYLIKEDTTGLFDSYHYKKGKIIDKGKLTGEVFNFKKLFDINGFSAKTKLLETLNIYGGLLKETEDGRLEISQDYLLYNPISKHIGDLNQIEGLNDIVSDWLDEYSSYILENLNDYKLFGKPLNSEQLQEVFLNTTIAYYEMDDLFEGSASYYKSAQDFLKRDKEVQAGGSVYGGAVDFTKPIGSPIEDIKTKEGIVKEIEIVGPTGKQTTVKTKNFINGDIQDGNLTVRNGFRAVVIENVKNVSTAADDIYAKIYNQLKAQGLSENNAKSIAENIARGYGWYDKETETFEDAIKTKYDDAQSYITLEEFIRRKYLDGTISQYSDLLWKLLDENYEFSKEDYDELVSKIQVQKNFYYDLGFDKKTGLIYPRQIKNAEFVLIPKFIKGTSLERLYEIMKENDINQVNTVETSKAANINVVRFWDNNGDVIEKNVDGVKTTELEDSITHNPESVQTYYYNYLYKQQDFVDHIEDEVNKAGIQVIKKIIDNISQSKIQENIEKELNDIKEKAIADGTFMKAPNGKPTNLTEKQWLQVRTKAFKEWFGDWENEPKNASRVKDENGEPLVVYHKTNEKFSIFNKNKNNHGGFWFSRDPNYYENVKHKYLVAAFINLRTPNEISHTTFLNAIDGNEAIEKLKSSKNINDIEYDGWLTRNYYKAEFYGDEDTESAPIFVMALNSNQIKSATDNSGLFSKNDDNIYDTITDKVYEAAQTIQNNLTKNIEESFNDLLDEYGWKLTDKGKIPQNLNFSKFFEDARREASRLGMDSNFLEYLTPDENGHPIYPLVMNDKSSKLESIAQSIFNKRIIRQTLPGFHAVQVSDIGFDSKLKYIPRKENGQEGEVDSYVEIKVAPWSQDIIDLINEFGEEEALSQLQKIGADEIIGYRIPTEGKQSIAKMKIVGFLDPSQGSTMVVAKDWVTQTGSDFDIDTIYTITHQTHLNRYKDGSVELIMDGNRTINEEKHSEKEVNRFKRNQAKIRRNNEIVEAFKTIISSDEAFEENMSRSNFDDINEAIRKYNAQFKDASVYNPITQIKFMQNAIDGRKLKARSVNRDTFNSISNKLHGMLVNGISVKYNLDEYNLDNLIAAYGAENVRVEGNIAMVNHKMIGWSKNNRNAVGKLITPYSSQTTSHILDAIKSGTIFNETDYTFSAFKTLVDIGIDYDTVVSFLAQDAITDLNETYNEYNSIFSNTKNDVIPDVYRKFLKKFKIDTKGLNLNDYTSVKQILEHLNNNKEFVKLYYDYWDIKPNFNVKNGEPIYTLFNINGKLIRPSLNKQKFERALDNKLSNDEKAVHYLGVLRMFEHAKEQGDAIEELVKVSRPDATGVKQTIFNTMRFIDNVNKEMKKDSKDITITTENGESFINALYKNKQYPYLSAAFEYGIVPSVAINSQLFITSTEPFYKLFTRLEEVTGKTFDEDVYKKFTHYLITKVYRGLSDIASPIKLDSKGNIHHVTGAENNSPNYWDQEFGRIYGFVEPENGDNFEVSDFVNPTPEDLEAYYKLTPLQKILFLQRKFAGSDNLFTKFYVSKTSNRVDKEKGYSYNTISINSESDNIESLYDEFDKAFFSKNLFIRAAAIDLVKYAFVVEGYNFRKGNISKIITNAALYNARNTGGLDLNKTLNDTITDMAYLNDENLENFIRSHSELLNQINITKPNNGNGTPTFGDTLNKFREIIKVVDNQGNEKQRYSGLIRITSNTDSESIFKKLGLPTHNKVKNTDYKYIKLREWSVYENKFVINVYKAIPQLTTNLEGKPMVSGYTLIPLNLLEEFEHDELSINVDNNRHYTQNFYYQNHTDIVYTIDDLSTYIAAKYQKEISGISQINAIEDALAGPPSPKRNVAVKLQEQLENWLEDRIKIKDAENFGIVQVAGFAKELTGVYYDNVKEQWVTDKRAFIIDEEGTTIVFKFSKYSNELDLRKYRKEYKKGKMKLPAYIEKVVNDDSIYWSENPEEQSLYKVEIYTELKPQEVEESEQLDSTTEEETQLSAFDGVFDDWFGNATTQAINTNASNEQRIFNVSNLIMKELQYNSYKGNTDIKRALTLMSVKGFIFGDEKSLHDYQTDIYKLAAKFYKEKANELKQKIHNFVVDGKVYNIADEEMYRKLKNEPKKAYELYRLLLEASNFGKKIEGIEKIVTDGDEETLKYIKSIQNSINEVVKEQGLKTAFDFVYNIYLAENFSKNPNVQMGLIQLTDIFGDSDWFDTNIGDVTNINHKQVQVVTKLALNELQKAKINAIEENAKFKKKWKEIENILGEKGLKEALSKIIDEDGKFIQKYNKEFLDDKKKIDTEVADAIKDYGVNSVEYLKAKQKQRKWYLANVVQPYAKSYYQEVIDATDEILNKYPEYLSEYLKLKAEYYGFGPYALLTDEEKNRRKAIGIKLNSMKELFTEDGKQNDKGIALDVYEDTIRSIKKKYFERIVSDEFIALVKHHRDIINAYKQKAGPYTLYDLYNNPDEKYDTLRESYDWLKYNTRYVIDEKSREQLQKAFKTLGAVVDENRREIQEIINDIPYEERTDISGTIIGTKYSLEQARKIKELTLKRFLDADVIKDTVVDSGNPNKYNIDGNLIKVVPKGPILNKAFFDDFFSDKQHRTPEEIKLRNKTYTKINNILKKAINTNGEVDVILLAENCTKDELQEVINGYNVLRSLDSINQDAYTNFDTNKEKPYEYATNDAAVLRQSINLNKIPNELKFLIERIIYQTEKDGITLKTDENGAYIGNKYLYGFIKLNEDENHQYTAEAKKYIDQEKTDARNLIEDNVEYVETEYYWQALKEATENGTYDEWYEANHYYDPFKHEMVPIKIWTTMQIKPTGSLKGTMENVATYDNTTSKIKKQFKNDDYKDKIDVDKNSSYSNPTYNSLTETEQKLRDLLLEYAQKYAIADFQKQFIKENYAPRLISRETTWSETLNDALNTVGLGSRDYTSFDWHNNIGFNNDFDAKFNMYSLIKTKGIKALPKKPSRASSIDDADYENKLALWKKECEDVEKYNKELDKALFSKDWFEVYKNLINQGEEYIAKDKIKDLLYLTLQDLREREAFDVGKRFSLSGQLIRDNRNSTNDTDGFRTVSQTNTAKVFENWIRRFLFDEYKNYTPLRQIADRIQSATSARFMMGNALSGVNNVAVGLVNIASEKFAKDYFDRDQFRRATVQYMLGAKGYVNHFFTGEVTNEQEAIMQLFDIETYDKVNNTYKDYKSYVVEKANDIAYGFLSMGEHYMQNTAVFAMLESHRLYENKLTHKWEVGTKYDFMQNIEFAAINEVLKQMAENNTGSDAAFFNSLLSNFKNIYLPTIKKDKRKALRFDRLQIDFVNDFVRSDLFNMGDKSTNTARKKKFIEEYTKVKKQLMENAEKEFNKLKTVKSQLKYNAEEQREVIIPNSELTEDHIAEITQKAISVNKKIHGVYDKLGAARIESMLLGSLAMQYRKHLYPGFAKFWQKKGYFSEFRQTNEYGVYQSLFGLLTIDQRHGGAINDVFNINEVNKDDSKFKQFMTEFTNATKLAINGLIDIKYNWALLPDWQKRNINRIFGYLAGYGASLAAVLAIYGLVDEDDIKKSNWWGSLIFLADRLNNEAKQFTPRGLYSEAENFRNTPVVGYKVIQDFFKVMGYANEMITLGDEYNPNYVRGTYKNENKVWVTIRKNIPIYNQYQRFIHIGKNNNFYKVGENSTDQTLIKNIGKTIYNDSESKGDENAYGFIR